MLHLNVKCRVVLALVMALTLTATPLAAQNTEYRCEYTHREICDSQGCRERPIDGSYLLLPSQKELASKSLRVMLGELPAVIRQCDNDGCRRVVVETYAGPRYQDAWQLDGGYMLRISIAEEKDWLNSNPFGDFVEAATSGLVLWVSYGHCLWDDGELVPERRAVVRRDDALTPVEDTERTVYRLYRSSIALKDARLHVASFDAEVGGEYNRENCEIARDLFVGQPGVTVRYWCELS